LYSQTEGTHTQRMDALWAELSPTFKDVTGKSRMWVKSDWAGAQCTMPITRPKFESQLEWRLRKNDLTDAERATRDRGSFTTIPNDGRWNDIAADGVVKKTVAACVWISIKQCLALHGEDVTVNQLCLDAKASLHVFFDSDRPAHKKALQSVCDKYCLTINIYRVRTGGGDSSNWINFDDNPVFTYRPDVGRSKTEMSIAYWVHSHMELITTETPKSTAIRINGQYPVKVHCYEHADIIWHMAPRQQVILCPHPIHHHPV
jgi:hypothetical protein